MTMRPGIFAANDSSRCPIDFFPETHHNRIPVTQVLIPIPSPRFLRNISGSPSLTTLE